MEILRRYSSQRTFIDNYGNIASARYKRVSKDLPYTTITTSRQTTLDVISMEKYGTPLMFWLIADFNDILDPMIDIEIGMELKIPVIS